MNGIREWAIMLCTASVGSAFVVFLIPNGNLKKTANIAVTLFLLTVVILPVFGEDSLDIDVPEFLFDDLPDEADYLLDYSEFYMTSGENVVERQITDILSEICTDDFSVHAYMKTDSDGNTVLSDIRISISNTDSSFIGVIEYEVGKLTGFVPKVMIENDDAESD